MAKPKRTQQRQGAAGTPSGTGQNARRQGSDATKTGSSGTISRTNGHDTRLAQIRARAGGQPPARQARKRGRKQSWWQGKWTVIATVVAVVVLVGIFVAISRNGGTSGLPNSKPAAASVVKQVTGVSDKVIASVGTGGVQNPVTPLTGQPALTGAGGKPAVVYIGAEYCPYCAAKRWSMIMALSRFGTFSNLQYSWSSDTDVYPQTPTFTFYGSTYTSKYIDFQPVEETTRDSSQILQTPTSAQQHLIDTYDTPQYVGGSTSGGIPFVDFGNKYLSLGPGYDPQLLSGLTHEQIAAKLSNPNDPVTLAIVGNANYLTATICTLTNNQPSSVCTSPTIKQIEATVKGG